MYMRKGQAAHERQGTRMRAYLCMREHVHIIYYISYYIWAYHVRMHVHVFVCAYLHVHARGRGGEGCLCRRGRASTSVRIRLALCPQIGWIQGSSLP